MSCSPAHTRVIRDARDMGGVVVVDLEEKPRVGLDHERDALRRTLRGLDGPVSVAPAYNIKFSFKMLSNTSPDTYEARSAHRPRHEHIRARHGSRAHRGRPVERALVTWAPVGKTILRLVIQYYLKLTFDIRYQIYYKFYVKSRRGTIYFTCTRACGAPHSHAR